MSDSDTNIGGWVIIGLIAAVVIYNIKFILVSILELILAILKMIQTLVTELFYLGLFVGAIYLLIKIIDSFKN